jgi:hypothetical protein
VLTSLILRDVDPFADLPSHTLCVHPQAVTNKACSPNPVAVVAVVIAIAAAIAGCSMQRQNADTTVTTSATFLGQWHVHGSTMDITPKSVTIVTYSCPMRRPCECVETDTLTVVSGDDKQLTLRVVAVLSLAGERGLAADTHRRGTVEHRSRRVCRASQESAKASAADLATTAG